VRRVLLRLVALSVVVPPSFLVAQSTVQDRRGATIAVEQYAPNIVRVTLSREHNDAVRGPGYGIVAKPSAAGWTNQGTGGALDLRSDRLRVLIAAEGPPHTSNGKPLGPFEANQAGLATFFNGYAPNIGVTITRADGSPLVSMTGWDQSIPNYKDGNADVLYDRRPTDDAFYRVGARFTAPADEHDYGLGQNQQGFLDLHGHSVTCAHDYDAAAGQSVCVPFVVTNKGYGIVWDNPSKTRVDFGFNGENHWVSEVGQRVSFFVIAGETPDEIYKGFRLLTGDVPMLPKSAYGYIQCKQRYSSQAELLGVAEGYRSRHLPLDTLVVDWFHYTVMGQMDMNPAKWPDPAEMNRKLHAMHIKTMVSVWPRFVPKDRYYATVLNNGWFEHLADGTPTTGEPYDHAGSDIDTTNPAAAGWYWNIVRSNYIEKYGFDSLWADETEPDIPPNGSYLHIGPGTEFFNAWPLFHTAGLYNGFRRDLPDTRALILSRDAYLGAQHNGTIFWSSDIKPNWDTLKRQLPTGLNFVASGMPYWSTDIGGWDYLPAVHKPEREPLLDPSDARANIGGYDDYPELYTRWFQYGAFQPNFRSHGSRRENEVWSYGKQAEPILENYLRLRYALMPYIYSVAHETHETGAPFMRALWMDFGADTKTADVRDEYMFGPALLVAPVVEQGVTSRSVYLPAGADWYNYWTNEKVHGGQTITVQAPIDTLPLFVKAGSILPMGSAVESTDEPQAIANVRVYPGQDADFALYRDDGKTYAYEQGKSETTVLHWDEHAAHLTQDGSRAWTDPGVVTVIK
jgi:alpha-D-xyloside xylohydrolase